MLLELDDLIQAVDYNESTNHDIEQHLQSHSTYLLFLYWIIASSNRVAPPATNIVVNQMSITRYSDH